MIFNKLLFVNVQGLIIKFNKVNLVKLLNNLKLKKLIEKINNL